MKNKKRVLVVATSRKTRGGITAVIKAHEQGKQWKEFQCIWIETHIDRGNILKIFYFISALMKFILIAPFYDIIHIHVASIASLRRKMFFFKISKIYKKKIISHFHPHKPEVIFDEKNKKFYKKMFLGSNKIIVLSPQWEKWINEALDISENIQVLYNPCPNITPFEKKCSNKYILFAGTIYKRKGYTDLIKGFSRIALKYPDWSVILAGNGEIEKGKLLAQELGIEKQVEFVGWVNGIDKHTLFNNASIFCLASSAEGFPMAVLDAWAYGLPVICTPVGGLPDIVEEKISALIFNYGDTESLSKQIEILITDEHLRINISKKSIEMSKTIFDVDNINNQLKIIYENLY
jgi:glycosyltransferase involved in cell wall biosynthesis